MGRFKTRSTKACVNNDDVNYLSTFINLKFSNFLSKCRLDPDTGPGNLEEPFSLQVFKTADKPVRNSVSDNMHRNQSLNKQRHLAWRGW